MDSRQPPATLVRHPARRGHRHRGVVVIDDLADLQGPVTGRKILPLRLFWSPPGREWDLGNPYMLRTMYQHVLGEAASPAELAAYLNGAKLTEVWGALYLPAGIRLAWEDHHPQLRAAAVPAAVV